MGTRLVGIMFLCTGNPAEVRWLRSWSTPLGKMQALSSGLKAHGLSPRAADAMNEVGIDISRNTSDFINQELLVTIAHRLRYR